MISAAEAVARIKLTPPEERAFSKIENTIDAAIYSQFNGAPFKVDMDLGVSLKVIFALQRRYEAAGWRVAVGPSGKPNAYALSFIAPGVPTSATAPSKSVAALASAPVLVREAGLRLHICMPTRSRPMQAVEVLQKYRDMAGVPVTLEVVVDEDDNETLAADIVQRLVALGCTITVGKHESKVEAVNGGKVRDFDVLLLASDDMVPVRDGYGKLVLDAMMKHFPHLDGAIYFDDGAHGRELCTLPIIGRRFHKQNQSRVYSPYYKSLFCDLEQTGLWSMMGRLVYVDEKIIEHRHHLWNKAPNDALYQRNDALQSADKLMFDGRLKTYRADAQFPFEAPPLWLSILICTLPERRRQLDRLLGHLWTQINEDWNEVGEDPLSIEVLVDDRRRDDGLATDVTVGEKRQALIERAKGHFVTFIDDDDWVSHDYIRRIMTAITKAHGEADCLSLVGTMTTSGVAPERFEHSVLHTEWKNGDGVYYRTPNHLNPVKRELALKAGFVSKSHGEDFDYSMKLKPLLHKELSTGAEPLYFYFYNPAKTAQEKP